ncbi:MAG TPA: 4Fe-4S double cluster binding domain-containing protein, partial [Rectinemataceae bacterium]|nr:4Fe-4S double cluster binding domain-containing protein [Rectinemataceae bacterium]
AACVLGLLLLPFSPRVGPLAWDWSALAPACSSCRRCVEACPTGALEGGFERARCLQHWSAIDAELPPAIEAAWGSRLYGCDSCLEACPRFRPEPRARTGLGVLGPGLPAAWFAATGEAEIRAALKGSALGLGWMSMAAFRRNAELAAKVV